MGKQGFAIFCSTLSPHFLFARGSVGGPMQTQLPAFWLCPLTISWHQVFLIASQESRSEVPCYNAQGIFQRTA